MSRSSSCWRTIRHGETNYTSYYLSLICLVLYMNPFRSPDLQSKLMGESTTTMSKHNIMDTLRSSDSSCDNSHSVENCSRWSSLSLPLSRLDRRSTRPLWFRLDWGTLPWRNNSSYFNMVVSPLSSSLLS